MNRVQVDDARVAFEHLYVLGQPVKIRNYRLVVDISP